MNQNNGWNRNARNGGGNNAAANFLWSMFDPRRAFLSNGFYGGGFGPGTMMPWNNNALTGLLPFLSNPTLANGGLSGRFSNSGGLDELLPLLTMISLNQRGHHNEGLDPSILPILLAASGRPRNNGLNVRDLARIFERNAERQQERDEDEYWMYQRLAKQYQRPRYMGCDRDYCGHGHHRGFKGRRARRRPEYWEHGPYDSDGFSWFSDSDSSDSDDNRSYVRRRPRRRPFKYCEFLTAIHVVKPLTLRRLLLNRVEDALEQGV